MSEDGSDLVNAYIAGVIDKSRAIRCTIEKDADTRAGYRIIPKLELRTSERELANIVLNWLNELGIFTNMETRGEKSPEFLISVNRRAHVETALKHLFPYLIVQQNEAEILLEEVIPRLNEDSVLTEDRFIEVVGYVDMLSDKGRMKRKYDSEYFREEFGKGATE